MQRVDSSKNLWSFLLEGTTGWDLSKKEINKLEKLSDSEG